MTIIKFNLRQCLSRACRLEIFHLDIIKSFFYKREKNVRKWSRKSKLLIFRFNGSWECTVAFAVCTFLYFYVLIFLHFECTYIHTALLSTLNSPQMMQFFSPPSAWNCLQFSLFSSLDIAISVRKRLWVKR